MIRFYLRLATFWLFVTSLVALVMWPLSWNHPRTLRRTSGEDYGTRLNFRYTSISWTQGALHIEHVDSRYPQSPWTDLEMEYMKRELPLERGWDCYPPGPDLKEFWQRVDWRGVGRLGWSHYEDPYHPGYAVTNNVAVPLWGAALACGVWPLTLVALAALKRRGTPASLYPRCAVCGYDCRATPDRCPECGRSTA